MEKPAMLPGDLIERLSALAAFSRNAAEVEECLRRLIETPANRWRIDWIAELFPGISEHDRALLRAAIEPPRPDELHGDVRERLEALRRLIAEASLDGFIVPQADQHLSEYLQPRDRRLAWLTGFTGSAGTAVVTRDKAWLFVDGRYTEQAKAEVDASCIELRHFRTPPIWKFMAGAVTPGSKLGYDPRLHSVVELERIQKELAKTGVGLVPVHRNPIDSLWTDRPAEAFSPIVVRPDSLAGRPMRDKLGAVIAALNSEKLDALLLGQLESIAWLYNIRGGDVANTPVADAFSVVFADGRAELFVERQKLTPDVTRHFGNQVSIRPIAEFEQALVELGQRRLTAGVDPESTAAWMSETLSEAGGTVQRLGDPTLSERLHKNKGEIENLKDAMVRDGACIARFLRWFESRPAGALPDELELVAALETFRGEDPMYRGPSFPSIVGIGGNGAIVHYHSTPATNRRLEPGALVLVDSGGQFLTGTTDITRTLIHSEPSARQRQIYTSVLKAHIALALARFPRGTVGAQLDAIARAPLWQLGINYDHGTGHGIGAFLGVHEGPVRIAPGGSLPIEPNMLFSNEPGAYLPGDFGIRLENSVIVVDPSENETSGAFLEFETLSLAAFDRQLTDAALLTAHELKWLNDYHARVRALVGPRLAGEDAAWLETATSPF
jgi:Xaa-Pro aminopeptidase